MVPFASYGATQHVISLAVRYTGQEPYAFVWHQLPQLSWHFSSYVSWQGQVSLMGWQVWFWVKLQSGMPSDP